MKSSFRFLSLLGALLGAAIAVSGCCGSKAYDNSIDLNGRLYPRVDAAEAESLVIVDLSDDNVEAQVACIGLQGIVNRDCAQKIYVMNSRCKDNHGGWMTGDLKAQAQMGQFWLDEVLSDLPKSYLPLNPSKTNPAFDILVETYKDYIKGVIIYDYDLVQATIEAATTIAGQTDGLIVSPDLYKEIESYGFSVIEDLRGRFKDNFECVDWLLENYWEGANHDVAFTWSHMTLDWEESWGAANKDYVVANRLFTYFLDIQVPEECHYYETIVKKYPAGTPIMGWTDELKADKLFADYGYVMVPFISVENMTVMSSFPDVTGEPIEPVAYDVEPGQVNIAFMISDGDNLLHTMIYMPYTISNSDAYGYVPITWIINPGITDLAPRVFDWYKKTMDANGQEMGAMMGDGSPCTDRYSGFSFYCAWARHYLDKSGILTLKQMIDGESVAWNVQPYCLEGGYAGTDWRGIGPKEIHMDNKTVHVGTTNHRDLDKIIDETPADEPLFLSVMIGCAHMDVTSFAKELHDSIVARNDGRKYVFMRNADLAATFRVYNGLPID